MTKQLVVGDSRQKDVGRGIARLSNDDTKELGIEAGAIIGLIGKKKTLAIAWPAYSEDIDKRIIRIDGFTRKNAGVAINETVKIFLPKTETATAILLAPVDMRLNVDEDFTNFVKNRLIERALIQGDITLVMMLGHAIPFNVTRVAPSRKECDGVIVRQTTKVSVLNEPYVPSKSEFSDVKFLFRKDWLQSVIQRLNASEIRYTIRGTEIEFESETEIIEKAKTIVEDSLDSIEILVNFYASSGELLGTLPWVSISLFGFPTAIYPDVQLPTYSYNLQQAKTRENPISGIGRCFKIGLKQCPKSINFSPKRFFVAIPFNPHNQDLYQFAIKPALEEQKLEPWKADEAISNIDIMCKICQAIQESAYVISDISEWNANVLFEMGLAYGMGKNVAILKDKKASVPVDLKGLECIEYGNIDELKRNLSVFFKSMLKERDS